MSTDFDGITEETIEALFERGLSRLVAEENRQNVQKMAEVNRQFDIARNSAAQSEQTRLNDEILRLVDEPGDKILLTAGVPDGKGGYEHKRFMVPADFNDFLAVTADLSKFAPADDASAADISERKVSFGHHFSAALGHHFSAALCQEPSCCDYYREVGEALFNCSYETREHRGRSQIKKNPERFKAHLISEANRFAKQKGWRGKKPELAQRFHAHFLTLSELIWRLPRGQQPSSDPNSRHLKHVMALGGEALRTALLEPGTKYDQPNGGAQSPARKALLDSIEQRASELAPLGITKDGMKNALKSLDRPRQRRKNQDSQ